MSTLRVDTLSTTDDSFSVQVADLLYSLNFSDVTDPDKGAALVGRGIQVFDSVVALKTFDKTSPSNYCMTTGYHTRGDGGDVLYYYDSADVTSVDNGGSVIVATDGSRLKAFFKDQVSVKKWGAKGDNIADDSLAFQACVDYLIARGGGDVLVPEGTYNFQSKRPAGLTPVAFEDPNVFVKDATNINFIGSGNAVLTNSVYPNNRAEQIMFYRTTNCSVTGLKFLGNNVGLPTEVNNCGIGALSNKGLSITKNVFTGFQGSYIASSWLFDSRIAENVFQVLGGTAVDCAFWQNVVFEKNDCTGNGLGNNLLGTTGFQCAFDTPNEDNNETGVFFREWTNHVTLRDNKFTNFFTGALLADMVDATVQGNDFHFNFITGDHLCNGLVITNTITSFAMRGITLDGNSFSNNGSGTSGGGLAIGAGTATVAEVTMTNNRVFDNSHYGLSLSGSPVKLRGSNNWFGNEQTANQTTHAAYNNNLAAGSMFIHNPGLNPATPVGHSLPAGLGAGNAVTNDRPYPVTIYQITGTGAHIITELGDDIALSSADTIRLGPFAKVYFTGVNTSAWTWVYD